MSTINRDRWSVQRFKQSKSELIERKATCATLGPQRGRGGRRLHEENRRVLPNISKTRGRGEISIRTFLVALESLYKKGPHDNLAISFSS